MIRQPIRPLLLFKKKTGMWQRVGANLWALPNRTQSTTLGTIRATTLGAAVGESTITVHFSKPVFGSPNLGVTITVNSVPQTVSGVINGAVITYDITPTVLAYDDVVVWDYTPGDLNDGDGDLVEATTLTKTLPSEPQLDDAWATESDGQWKTESGDTWILESNVALLSEDGTPLLTEDGQPLEAE